MTVKTPAKPATGKQVATQAKKNPNALELVITPDVSLEQATAKAATKASINASAVVKAFQTNLMGEDVGITELSKDIDAKIKKVNDGDLSEMEAMLVGQATALQTMFAHLAKRASAQEYLKQYQTYMTLALKAQAQSRATISALVDLKYPKQATTFVKQANISGGHQQVNNGHIQDQYAPARDFQNAPNKLLEEGNHGERLDFGAPAAAGRANQKMDALAAVNRA